MAPKRRSSGGRRSEGGSRGQKLPSAPAAANVGSPAAGLAVISSQEALEHLQQACQVLAERQQGNGADLEDCARAVANDEFMRHASSEVRLWTAKCLAEVLRIWVPQPPLDPSRFRPMLQLFLEQLTLLSDPSSSAYKHAFGLLERLTEIRGFMLLFEEAAGWPSDELLVELVSACLVVGRGRGSSTEAGKLSEEGKHAQQRLEATLAQLVTGVLSEADEIPKKTLAELVEELMPRRRNAAAATGLVRRILGSLAHRSAALPINDFLNTSLYAEDKAQAEDEEAAGPDRLPGAQERLEGVLIAINELYTIEPALVARVLPNLHADLQCSDPDRRRAVTALVGQMLAHYHQQGSGDTVAGTGPRMLLAATHPLLADRHRERLGDADDGVRLMALDGAAAILQQAATLQDAGEHAERTGSGALVKAAEAVRDRVAERGLDPHDAVRLRAVEVAAEVAASSRAGLDLMLPVLPEMCKRVLDKKPRVREACAEAAARIYAQYALPAWTEGRYEDAQPLAWIPQLLCEAYSVFSGGRLGHVSQLEEYLEQDVLGCGASLQTTERALALLGFHASASQDGEEAALRGLGQLLARKRDANSALRRYLELRMAKEAPLLEGAVAAGAGALVPSQGAGATQTTATEVLENLARCSPTLEDKSARPETLLVHLRALDAVRDKALWKQLDHLMNPCMSDCTADLPELLKELDRLLRVHRLGELAPLVRRALLSTWFLPDQASVLLDLWKGSWPSTWEQRQAEPSPPAELRVVAGNAVGDLPRYFPGAFASHAGVIAEMLVASSKSGVEATLQSRCALRALAAMGKRVQLLGEAADIGELDPHGLADQLLQALGTVSGNIAAGHVTSAARGSASRKIAKVLALLRGSEAQALAAGELLAWAEKHVASCRETADDDAKSQQPNPGAAALHLAAAVLAHQASRPNDSWKSGADMWLEEARHALLPGSEALSEVRCAAAELLAAAGTEEDVAGILLAPVHVSDAPALQAPDSEPVDASRSTPWFDPLPSHAACCAIRALRHGSLALTTRLLERLACRLCNCLGDGRPTFEAEELLQALQSLPRLPASCKVRLADRLRLCATLPAVFSLALLKRHREAVQRMLQASLLKAGRQATKQEPLLDFVVACFVHFLSRLDVFKREVSAAASAFPESSKVSAFFCEALLRSDPQKGAENAGVALRVCDRVRYFVDREEPASDAIQRAASVLRYVVEKRCPELGVQGSALLQGAERGSMPAGLFAIRQAAQAQAALPPTQDSPQAIASAAIAAVVRGADSPYSSSSSRRAGEAETPSPLPAANAVPGAAQTTPQRRQSLLKRNASSASPASSGSGDLAVASVARPMARGGGSPNITGASITAALSANASAKKAKKQRVG